MRNSNRGQIRFICAATLCAALAAPKGVADDIIEGRDYFAILPGYSFPSKALETTGNGATISGIFGHELARHLDLEFNVQSSTFETGLNKGTDLYQNGGTVDLVYTVVSRQDDSFLVPFILAGLGGVYDDFYPKSRRGPALIANGGIGAVTRPFFSDAIRLRFDARYVEDFKDGNHREMRALAGFEIPLGRVQRHVDYLPGKTVEVVKETVKEVPRPWVDSDGDGVDDDHDRCPDTPRGMKVDANGCVIENQTFGLQGVTFDYNVARLTPNAETVLDLVSRAFAGQPTLKVEIAGHTDSSGSAEYNLHLSQQRAEAVRRYLISKGVIPDQLTAAGYGKSQLLINPETSPQDRERNRRVELRVLAR